MKRRSCRRNADEELIHDKAVRIRKMTDDQLVKFVDSLTDLGRKEGYEAGLKEHENKSSDIADIMERIGTVKGIGKKKLEEIKEVLMN